MKYLINLFKVISPNVGDSVLVFIGEDEKEFYARCNEMAEFFRRTRTLIKVSKCQTKERLEVYIEYSLVKGK